MTKLRVLNVEDCPDDSLLIHRELVKAGYEVVFERVETAQQLSTALDRSEWDVVISDYSLPDFSAPDALALLTERGLDIPFILISGVITEERAISVVGARASDYLLKSNLARLVPAVKRLVHQSELKRETSVTKDALEQEIEAREEERHRIARELHDEAGQVLASLLARARTIEEAPTLEVAKVRANELRELTAEAMDSITRLSLGLHPTALDELGLSSALQYYLDEYENAHGIEVVAKIQRLEPNQLTEKAQLGIYRIVQEALTNIAKHASATVVSVTLAVTGEILILHVKDNGRGFDIGDSTNPGGRYGLRSMHDRSSIIGGRLHIESMSGGGTSVTLTLPLKPEVAKRWSGRGS